MSNHNDGDDRGADGASHLADLPDGSGCFEIWEHLSGAREASASD